MTERVLTLRELNRATLARQILLERKRVSPPAVIERLVGLQAQWPPSPYIGIWTRTTSFRREALERELVSAAVAKGEWGGGERGGGGGGGVRAHLLHHHETALWHGRPEGRFVALEEPEAHNPVEARAEILRRYFAAFGPASRRDVRAWSMRRTSELAPALERLEPLRRFRDEHGRELLDVARAPLPDAETPARFASCRSGTTCCSRSRIERVSFLSSTGRQLSA